jgi:hypothetical protein
MLNSLSTVIIASLAFAEKHKGHPLDPSTFLKEDKSDELAALDAQFYAFCQLLGLSLSELEDPGPGPCRNLRLPFIVGTCHVPIEDGPDGTKREMVGSGMVIFPTFEWQHAMRSLLAAALVIEAKGQPCRERSSASSLKDQSAGVGTISDSHENGQNAGRKSAKPRRGRPAGSKTQELDSKLYLDWQAAQRENGITKAQFLHERGLPDSYLAAIERGRKRAKTKNRSGNK